MNRRWICNDIWMDMFPHFDRPQLGLKLALLSPRFNALVDKHFDDQSKLPILEEIKIRKDIFAEVQKLRVHIAVNSEKFPLSDDRPLPDKIRFNYLQINHIDHSVLAFFRANKNIWDRGTKLNLRVGYYKKTNYIVQPIWNALIREILPVFAPNIRHLGFPNSFHLDNLLRLTSATVLSDFNINSIDSGYLFPDAIANDGPSSADQILSEWLHIPAKDGQPKRLICCGVKSRTIELVNNFNEKFIDANSSSSASYKIQFTTDNYSIVPFELVNERTNEKLTLTKASEDKWGYRRWIMKRCQIGETTAAVQWEDQNWDDLNNVNFKISGVQNCNVKPLNNNCNSDQQKK